MFPRIKTNSALLAVFASQLAYAGPPVAYDGWSASSGNIDTSVSCGNTGVSCRTLASDDGFIYEEVNTPVYSFLRLIMTEQGVSGDPSQLSFSSETFTPFATQGGGIAQGVASKQVVRDATDNFLVSSEVQKSNMRGLFATSAEEMFTAKIDQSFSNAEITSGFAYTNYTNFATTPNATSPDTNVERGRKLDISQEVLIGEPGDTTQKQVFAQSQRKGNAGNGDPFPFNTPPAGLPAEFTVNNNYFVTAPITTAGSATLPTTINGNDTGGTATISWNNGDDISTTWIGQSSNVQTGVVGVSYQTVENNTAGTAVSALLMDIPEPGNPFDWNANFGTAPSLP